MPLMTWATHVIQWPLTEGSNTAMWSKTQLLVIADQHAAVNTFPGLVHTARHTMGVCNTRSQYPNRKEGAAEGGISDWGEVVTR